MNRRLLMGARSAARKAHRPVHIRNVSSGSVSQAQLVSSKREVLAIDISASGIEKSNPGRPVENRKTPVGYPTGAESRVSERGADLPHEAAAHHGQTGHREAQHRYRRSGIRNAAEVLILADDERLARGD